MSFVDYLKAEFDRAAATARAEAAEAALKQAQAERDVFKMQRDGDREEVAKLRADLADARALAEVRKSEFEAEQEAVEKLNREMATLRAERATAMADLAAAQAQIEKLRGLTPELPPRFPPNPTELPAYGIRWNGEGQPLAVPMDDGYWTPWHIAIVAVETLRHDLAAAKESLAVETAAAYAAQQALRDATEWRPIETAPRDGTVVIGWMPTWYQGRGGAAAMLWSGGYWRVINSFSCSPTNWLPIPPLAQEAQPS